MTRIRHARDIAAFAADMAWMLCLMAAVGAWLLIRRFVHVSY
jgi:hypothetical protein